MVITGGPGVGKTTTVNSILRILSVGNCSAITPPWQNLIHILHVSKRSTRYGGGVV
ncbi:AAA family ATPase [Hoeflea sp.]|uniref:AAA family ATPase n=1 Tax=Hoeflea sp. TaxID=1940281 RepID=UPI003B01E4C4